MNKLKGHSKMKTYLINNIISKFTQRFLLGSLLLFALAGNAWAQTDQPYVIKLTNYNNTNGDHYLAHVKVGEVWVLQDATTFSPNCLWYSGRELNLSGTNHNYYFIDDANNYRFLSAPLQEGGSLSLSDSKPEVFLLNNTDHNYYFYDWDYDNYPEGSGVARGHQYNGVVSEDECQFDWEDEQCWEVYWVEYYENGWKLSPDHSYNITENSGRFRLVTDTPNDMQITGDGLADLTDFIMEFTSPSHLLSATIGTFTYIPAYHKYDFDEVTVPGTQGTSPTLQHHTYYYPFGETNTNPPTTPQSSGEPNDWTYNWTISGEGAEYLSFTNEGEMSHTSSLPAPTLYYRTVNNTGDKQATLTLTVTYSGESRQTKSASVTVKTPCQNPSFSANVNYEGVTISWTPTAESYVVSWKKQSDSEWQTATVDSPETSYFLANLDYATTYDYKVKATCDSNEPTPLQFTTLHQPKAVVGGAVFGGGRMADVHGKTEVVIINTDSIGAVYGGNDIAGQVLGYDGDTPGVYGSTIKLGVTSSDPDAVTYNNSQASTKVRIGDVYGGGNGYYAYDGSTFVAADDNHTTFEVPNGGTVKAMTQSHQVGEVVWENTTGADYILAVPTIIKTAITVSNDVVKVDSIFGGAKNAFITNTEDDANGTSVTVNGGTAFAVFGGNNFGGNQTAGKHYIEINDTKTNVNSYPDGLGIDYGICYVFGGGNKVQGLTTDIIVSGGMCDTVFAGGNAADVTTADVTVNCSMASGSNGTFGNVFSNAISSYNGTVSINNSYPWNGTGLYNVRALFGGNNRADMEGLPTVTLTSGSVGTVYGGGNSGRMLAQTPETSDKPIATEFGANYIGDDELPIYYGTHVIMDSPNMLVDYLYGGCQMSDVLYSTWVEVKDGHVGTVYGGCNIGGDVGSTRLSFDIPNDDLTNEHKQAVQGATYVKASGGTIYGDLYAGSNGYYHCNDGVHYVAGLDFSDQYHVGRTIPSHNETHVKVSKQDAEHAVTVKGDVYAGGNLAYVGFINATTNGRNFPTFRGFCSVRMDGGRVEGSVYGGGNRASIFGSNEVQVSGGSIGYNASGNPTGGALYGGNDKAGQVAQITNRVLPDSYSVASDGATNLKIMGVKTYVGITGNPQINTVYGGGNGAYDYTPDLYCDVTDQPVQSNTFVDVCIDADGGSQTGGYINTVYGGGNGVTVLDRITVFLNVQNANNMYDHVGTIFGGNNMGDLDILSDIVFVNGQVNTVYGGCNEGAMLGSFTVGDYSNVGSLIQRGVNYIPVGTSVPRPLNGVISGYAYGGCRMNGVTNNTLVLVEGGEHPATFFGGSDVSGDIGGLSQVVVTGGSTGTVYGGGNGGYEYSGSDLPPYCTASRVDVLGGTCTGNVFGGGLAGESGETHVTVDGGSVGNNVFGGGNEAGVKIYAIDSETNTTGNSTITMNDGFVGAGVYGGCNTLGAIEGDVAITLTGGTVGTADNPAYIHGGGYGEDTSVANNIAIQFGVVSATANEYPKLFGDLYGGSAFGSVNTTSSNTTTININNGTINGNVYGGGLGDTDDASKGWVYGEVHVNVGGENPDGTYYGKASFNNTSIFGGNNANASPQTDTYVDIYQTAHTTEDTYTYTGNDRTYAIYRVFGGGNVADFAPENADPHSTKKAHVSVHGCENTIEEVFGGSNAANAISTHTIVDGGRFNYIFGGGNGIIAAANVGLFEGEHHTYSQIKGGHVGFCFGGSNRLGNCVGVVQDTETPSNCDALIIDNLFNGGNNADQIGEQVLNLDCSDAKTYLSAYGGCRLGTVYGNITVNVTGGTIGKLFGGCQGASDYAADVKRYPTMEEINQNPGNYTQEVIDFMRNNPSLAGTGGNITINIHGGAVGEVFGGCDIKGNVEGKITVNVERTDTGCGFFLGNVYGASNATDYSPLDATLASPEVNIIKGEVGGEYDFNANGTIQDEEKYAGNVFGGGNMGDVTANPKVKLGDPEHPTTSPVTILGNVYGGGKIGKINGSTNVIIVPTE